MLLEKSANALEVLPFWKVRLRVSAASMCVGLRAKNCQTGDVLDEEQVQAAQKEDVLNALSQIAVKFRKRVGESSASVEKYSTPLVEATTPSFEAWKAYSTGIKVGFSSGWTAGLPFFKRAVEIDPNFATAHAQLGISYSDLGESVSSTASTTEAYRLRDRTSEREKLFITALYDRQVTGNLEKALETTISGNKLTRVTLLLADWRQDSLPRAWGNIGARSKMLKRRSSSIPA